MFHAGVCCNVLSVLCSLVVTCWERADLLAVVYVVLSLSQICPGPHQKQGWGWRHETGLSPPVKYFTDRSKAVLLLWIVYVYVFVLSCVSYVFVRVCLYVLCGHLLGKGWPLVSRLLCPTVSLSFSHWYPGSGVVLDCIDSWSLHPYLLIFYLSFYLFITCIVCLLVNLLWMCFHIPVVVLSIF